MRRVALGLTACVFAACGLTDVKLENFPRPFACDRNGGDGGAQCVAGWLCGADDRCFDPSELDGGTTRDCTRDAQCPNGFRCGQKVGLLQRCVQLGVNAPSPCLNDHGCEGTNRCDTFAQRCVSVTDVLATGSTSSFGARELNPRVHEAAPLLFAMSRFSRVPDGLGSADSNNRQGVFLASLFEDGGLRVTAEFRAERRIDGGATQVLYDQRFGLEIPATDVTDLALSAEGVVVRASDGGTFRANFSGTGWQPLGPSDFLRQADPLDPNEATQLLRVSGNSVEREGAASLDFGSPVREVVWLGTKYLAVTDDGLHEYDGAFMQRTSGALPFVTSRGAVAALFNNQPALYVDTSVDGGFGVAAWFLDPMGWGSLLPFAGCPDGKRPLQISLTADRSGRAQLLSRCGTPPASFPVLVSLGNGGSQVIYESVAEDQVPFQSGLVPQRASALVRAHAGGDGRAWYADDPEGKAVLGSRPLKALLLDRQPETMLSFRDPSNQRIRVFAEASGSIFVADSNGGLVSELGVDDVVPLSVVSGERKWIVTTDGVYDISNHRPRLLASLPAGAAFVAPSPGASLTIELSGLLRKVIVVASADTMWTADVTDAQSGPFAQPALFVRSLVPVPGVPLRSLTILPSSTELSGYLTTTTKNLSFRTTDLVVWKLNDVATSSALGALPLEVWTDADGGAGRTGFSDGVVWSLPIMVPLTRPLLATDGGALLASDFGHKCNDVLAATSEGLFRAAAVFDGGLPAWEHLTLPITLDSTRALRFYETTDDVERLFVGTQTGQVLELTATCR